MGTYLDGYLGTVKGDALRESIKATASAFLSQWVKEGEGKPAWYSLLLGHVQSGKTGQLLGVIAALADSSITNFLLLTTDNRRLQSQTLLRAQTSLPGMLVVGETDDVSFMTAPAQKPVVVVLKKNARVLQTWRNTILSTARCKSVPLVVVDDEADATSLNTRVNVASVSRINKLLGDIRDDASQCIYIQVTATPQAVLLQSSLSGWKPESVLTIEPGAGYLGGRYFFTDPPSHAVRFTSEDEAKKIIDGDPGTADGLVASVFSYLVNCGEEICRGGSCCNFLIHPSVRVSCHNAFVAKFSGYLSSLKKSLTSEKFDENLKASWLDLHSTCPEIHAYPRIRDAVVNLVKSGKINVFTINSKSDGNKSYDSGFNIVVGGNSLGRGLTLPRLQVFYYCRVAKTPQADTMWQHSRMFGYDRARGLVRVFVPKSVHKIFYNICESNEVLFEQIKTKGMDGVQLLFPEGVRPTRKCVVDNDFLSLVQGGVNFFPFEPDEANVQAMDALLANVDSRDPVLVSVDDMMELLGALGAYDPDDWDKAKFMQCLATTKKLSSPVSCKILVRRDRDVSKGTGSLLSENDRSLIDDLSAEVVLVFYRLNGKRSQGWKGNPFWVPNIKFPNGLTYYSER